MSDINSSLTQNSVKIMASDFNTVHREYNPIVQVFEIDNKALTKFGIYHVSIFIVRLVYMHSFNLF